MHYSLSVRLTSKGSLRAKLAVDPFNEVDVEMCELLGFTSVRADSGDENEAEVDAVICELLGFTSVHSDSEDENEAEDDPNSAGHSAVESGSSREGALATKYYDLTANDSDDDDCVAAYATMRTCSKVDSGPTFWVEKPIWLDGEDYTEALGII